MPIPKSSPLILGTGLSGSYTPTVLNPPSLREFESYKKSKAILTEYLKIQGFDIFATDLYTQKHITKSNGDDLTILIFEPINFKIGRNYNDLYERNIHIGIDILNEDVYEYTNNTLYFIDNENIDKTDESILLYSNPNIKQYLDIFKIIPNSNDNKHNTEAFNIHNIIYEKFINFNQHSELDNLIQNYLQTI
jgi:hypothetical protein